MTSSNKGIIRGARVDGVVFCSPTGGIEKEESLIAHEKENLKALEEFWIQKGIQEGKQKGYKEGFQEGKEKGLQLGKEMGKAEGLIEGKSQGVLETKKTASEDAMKEVNNLFLLSKVMSEKISMEKRDFIDRFKPELIRFCFSICESVLRRHLQEPAVLSSLIEELVKSSKSIIQNSQLIVFLHPSDYVKVKEHCATLFSVSGDDVRLIFDQDPTILEGDLRLESSVGLLNYEISRILKDLEEKVLEVDSRSLNS